MAPNSSAVRVALWRALHVEVDSSPHVINDTIGLQLVAPHDNWRGRPDMDPEGTRGFRAGIVARARFVDDLVTEQVALGVPDWLRLVPVDFEAGDAWGARLDLAQRYFAGRADGLRPASGESFPIATT